jgi:hypothetical protein
VSHLWVGLDKDTILSFITESDARIRAVKMLVAGTIQHETRLV